MAHVRFIRIEEKEESCSTEATDYQMIYDIIYDGNWRFCSLDEVGQGVTPVFDGMASIYKSDNMTEVNPFNIGHNNVLEQKIKEMLGNDIFEINLMFVQ